MGGRSARTRIRAVVSRRRPLTSSRLEELVSTGRARPARRDMAELPAPPQGPWAPSAASVWEIGIKQSLGKLTVRGDLEAVIDAD